MFQPPTRLIWPIYLDIQGRFPQLCWMHQGTWGFLRSRRQAAAPARVSSCGTWNSTRHLGGARLRIHHLGWTWSKLNWHSTSETEISEPSWNSQPSEMITVMMMYGTFYVRQNTYDWKKILPERTIDHWTTGMGQYKVQVRFQTYAPDLQVPNHTSHKKQ